MQVDIFKSQYLCIYVHLFQPHSIVQNIYIIDCASFSVIIMCAGDQCFLESYFFKF